MTNERIIEKIRKCLELANNNPSENEARDAALQAQKLLAKYGISMADVEQLDDQKREIGEVDVWYSSLVKGVVRAWKYDLATIVARNFRCKYFLYGKKGLCFYGYKEDAEVAAQVYTYLFRVGDRLADRAMRKVLREYHKRGESAKVEGIYNSFIKGYLAGISNALDTQCTALALVITEEVKEAYSKRIEGCKTMRVGMKSQALNNEAYKNGFEAGKETMNARNLENKSA